MTRRFYSRIRELFLTRYRDNANLLILKVMGKFKYKFRTGVDCVRTELD